jgi:nitrate reductase delta subunit
MPADPSVYDLAAGLLCYPDAEYPAKLAACRAALEPVDGEAADHLGTFARMTADLTTEAFQELFTRTLDLNPACTLDLGWHLYGEAYERGAFLVEIREALEGAGITESAELPDHLSHIVMLLGRLDQEAATTLAVRVIPAIDTLIGNIDGKDDPIEHLLKAIHSLVMKRHALEVTPRG